jgi:tetratricopeptide (TPR) repeat protein/glycosyltransferase involved in cell wall biosynthesis
MYSAKPIKKSNHISILMPTRKRTVFLEGVLDSLEEKTQNKDLIDLWLYVDHDDGETLDFIGRGRLNAYSFKIHWAVGERTGSQGEMVNILWRKCRTGAGIYMPLPDDYKIITHSWDRIVRETFNRFSPRILLAYVDEPTGAPGQTVLFLLSAEWINCLGRIVTHYFPYWFDDTWLDEVSQMVGRRIKIDIRMEPQSGKGKTIRMRNLPFWHKFYIHTADERLCDAEKLRRAIFSPESVEYRRNFELGLRMAAHFRTKMAAVNKDERLRLEEAYHGNKHRAANPGLVMHYRKLEHNAQRILIEKAKTLLQSGRAVEALMILKTTAYADRRLPQAARLYRECMSVQAQAVNETASPSASHRQSRRIETTKGVSTAGQATRSFSHAPQTVQPGSLDRQIPPEIRNDSFYDAIQRLTVAEKIRTILEIGSSSGKGSTEAFVKGLSYNPHNPVLHCIEVSKGRFNALHQRYKDHPQVHCHNVSSVPLSRFPKEADLVRFYSKTPTALNQYPIGQVKSWLRDDRAYVAESGVFQDGIRQIKSDHGIDYFDVVLIDGSEFTGRAELDEIYGAKVIMLDDINSFKNYHNYQRLKNDCDYELEKENWTLRNGYAIFRRKAFKVLPVHFFTIVLNGEPFIRYHLKILKALDIPWHWHIIEGVADLKHDTAWSVRNGGRISKQYHQNGLSIDGTSAYLDHIAQENPRHITLYRKAHGEFWDGKLEMISAPLKNLPEKCLLWQMDADELWRAQQIQRAHRLFREQPDRTAAFFHCHFFVGPDLVTTTTDGYSHNTAYEWIRLWRYQKGMQWKSHEPPRLMVEQRTRWVDTARIAPFSHQETESAGLVFTHHAYCLASQVQFKEDYYGYTGAVDQWRQLQKVKDLPVRLASYFGWVHDGTQVDSVENRTIGKNVPPVLLDDISDHQNEKTTQNTPHLIIDGVIFQLQAGRPHGISRVWRNLIQGLHEQMPGARISVLQRDGFPVPVSDAAIHIVPCFELGDHRHLDADDEMLGRVCRALKADVFLSTYYTRAPGVINVVMIHDMIPELFGYDMSQPEWLAKQRVIETGDAFICVSRVTRNDLLASYPQTKTSPMVVVPNGLDGGIKAADQAGILDLKKKLGLTGEYVLLVGNRQGYKGGGGLLKALSKLPSKTDFTVLCVGGERQPSPEELQIKNIMDVRHAGQLTDSELAAAYSGAHALLVPSKYEGFGLPVIEAMACGCPVVAEKSPAVEEVGGDAVYFADLSCPASIDQTLQKLREQTFREGMTTKGRVRAARFNWDKSTAAIGHCINAWMDKTSILLTAVVSTYNASRFIKGCLEDLVHQTIADRLEIIVVDSASQEDEAAVVRDFQKHHAHIKYIRTPERESVYQAWNRGIKFALGQYVSNANTDDRHRQDAFEQMVHVLEGDENIALVYADVLKTRTANETFRHCTPTGMFHWYDWDRSTLLEKGCFIGPQPVWRNAVHQDYGYFDENYEVSADFEFWLRISQTNEFYHLAKPLGLYMDRSDSIEHANAVKKEKEDQEILQRYRQAAKEKRVIGISPQSDKHLNSKCRQTRKGYAMNAANVVQCKKATSEEITPGGRDMPSLETIFNAIKHLVDNGDKQAALWAMAKLLSDFPENARLHSEMAALAYELADMPTALAHFKQAAALEPRNTAYLKNLGDVYYVVEKDPQNALKQYERVLDLDPDNIPSLVMAGHVSTALHRYGQGRQYYTRALELDPQNREVRQILEKMNPPAADQNPSAICVEELYAKAQTSVRDGDPQTAISLLEQLLARDDTHGLAHNDLGVLHYESGNPQAALDHYERAAGLQPENETFQKNLADFYMAALGDPRKAMQTYVQVLKLNPRDVDALLACGQICMGLGQKDDAGDFINAALETEPWNENAQHMLRQLDQPLVFPDPAGTDFYEQAKAKASEGDGEGAIQDLRQYVAAVPDNANAHNDLGVLYYEAGDKNKALEAYEQAVQLAPSEHTYLKNLADFYLIEQGRAEDAMKLYLRVLEANPQDIESLIASGMVCAALGQVEDAKLFYNRVIEIEPWNENAQNALNDLVSHGQGCGPDGAPSAAAG